MTPGFAKPRHELPWLPYGVCNRVIINAHNFTPPSPVGIGDEVAWWCPSLDNAGNGTLTFYDQITSGINGSLENGETGDWTADTTSGGVRAITLDGVNERGLIADDNRFSFGNGSSDSPFSVSLWIRFTSLAAAFSPISKSSSLNLGEWSFIIGTSGTITFRCVDASASGRIGRVTAASSVAINTWYHFCATYSGSGTAAGVKIYRNGTRVDTTNANAGSYTAMENTTEPVTIGSRGTVESMPGRWDDCRVFDVDLSGVAGAITALASKRGYQP